MRLYLVLLACVCCCRPYTPEPLSGAERAAALDAYMQSFSQQLAERWNPRQALRDYPNQALASGSYTTVIWVVVDQLGDVVTADVTKSVRDYVDREAVRAIEVASPLPAPPSGLLYRSSRGLVAAFPVQFTITLPGEAGQYVQNRQNLQGQITHHQPFELAVEL